MQEPNPQMTAPAPGGAPAAPGKKGMNMQAEIVKLILQVMKMASENGLDFTQLVQMAMQQGASPAPAAPGNIGLPPGSPR